MNMRSVGQPMTKPLFRGEQKTSASQSKAKDDQRLDKEQQEFEEFMATLGREEESSRGGDRFVSGKQTQSAPHAADAEKQKAQNEARAGLEHYLAKLVQGRKPSPLRQSFTPEN